MGLRLTLGIWTAISCVCGSSTPRVDNTKSKKALRGAVVNAPSTISENMSKSLEVPAGNQNTSNSIFSTLGVDASTQQERNSSLTLTAGRWKTLWWNGGRRLVGAENASTENSTTLDVEATKQLNSSLTLTAGRWKTLWWNGGRRLVGVENASTENSTTLDVE